MLKKVSLEEVKKFWPQSAPNINNILTITQQWVIMKKTTVKTN